MLLMVILSPFFIFPFLMIDNPAMKLGMKSLMPKKMDMIMTMKIAAVSMFNTIVVMPIWFRAITMKIK